MSLSFRFTCVTDAMLEDHNLRIYCTFRVQVHILYFMNCSQIVRNVNEFLSIARCEAISPLAHNTVMGRLVPFLRGWCRILQEYVCCCLLLTRLSSLESEPLLVRLDASISPTCIFSKLLHPIQLQTGQTRVRMGRCFLAGFGSNSVPGPYKELSIEFPCYDNRVRPARNRHVGSWIIPIRPSQPMGRCLGPFGSLILSTALKCIRSTHIP